MLITFKENSITEKEETFLHELLRSTQWGDLNLGKGRWKQRDMDLRVQKIQKWGIKSHLNLESNQEPNIILQISHVNFNLLKILTLSENMITSIEVISRTHAPSLEILDLSGNFIISVKTLRNLHCPRLNNLNLTDNLITNFTPLRQGNWRKSLKIRIIHQAEDKNIHEIPSFFRPIFH